MFCCREKERAKYTEKIEKQLGIQTERCVWGGGGGGGGRREGISRVDLG